MYLGDGTAFDEEVSMTKAQERERKPKCTSCPSAPQCATLRSSNSSGDGWPAQIGRVSLQQAHKVVRLTYSDLEVVSQPSREVYIPSQGRFIRRAERESIAS